MAFALRSTLQRWPDIVSECSHSTEQGRKNVRGRRKGIRTAVDNTRARLVVLLLRAPEVLEGGERGKNGTTDPDGVLPLRGSDDLDLHARRRERSELLLHTVGNTGEHGGTTGEDDVAVQVTTDIEIALEDGVVAV